MESHDIKQLNNTHMFEMCMVVYGKRQHLKFMNGKVETNTKALGFAKVFGNKGGMQIYFTCNDFHFNVFGLHLLHGQDNRVKRDNMMEDIVRYFKNERPEMDPDVSYDYSFILGDLNYRMDSNFHDMIMTQQINLAHELLDQYDQLSKSRRGGQMTHYLPNGQAVVQNHSKKYPGYYEAKIDFKPTYKRNKNDNGYKNKKQ